MPCQPNPRRFLFLNCTALVLVLAVYYPSLLPLPSSFFQLETSKVFHLFLFLLTTPFTIYVGRYTHTYHHCTAHNVSHFFWNLKRKRKRERRRVDRFFSIRNSKLVLMAVCILYVCMRVRERVCVVLCGWTKRFIQDISQNYIQEQEEMCELAEQTNMCCTS